MGDLISHFLPRCRFQQKLCNQKVLLEKWADKLPVGIFVLQIQKRVHTVKVHIF